MTLLFQLREAARVERDELIRWNLKHAADQLSESCDKFAADPIAAHLQTVNGHWAHAMRMLDYSGRRNGGGTTGAGLKEGALLQDVARQKEQPPCSPTNAPATPAPPMTC